MLLGNVLDIGTPSDDTCTGAKIVDDAIDSEHYAAGSIDKEHLADEVDIFAGTSLTAADLGSGIHIRTADSSASAHANADELVVEGSAASGISILSGTGSDGSIYFGDSGDDNIGMVRYEHSGNNLVFRTNASDALTINSAGKVGIGDTALSANAMLSVEGDIGSPLVTFYDKRSTSTVDVLHINSDVGSTKNKNFQIEADGDVQNTNNSYGSLSDRKFKENETDANSQWNDIKALKIKNYNLKIFPDITHLGVIAQDLEASGMNGLVKNKPDVLYTETETLPEGKNVGDVKEENYKEVKYSVLYMKSVKALQEAMERIETLEAKVTALENA
jgi:hypothetical protein